MPGLFLSLEINKNPGPGRWLVGKALLWSLEDQSSHKFQVRRWETIIFHMCTHTTASSHTHVPPSTHASTQLHTHSYHTYARKNSWESSRVRDRRLWYWCQSMKAKLLSFCRCFSGVSLLRGKLPQGLTGANIVIVIVIISMYVCPSPVSVSGYCVHNMEARGQDWVSFLSNYPHYFFQFPLLLSVSHRI